MEYLIDPLLPTREIHLLAGGSGTGKTTLIFQMLEAWRLGRPVFGCKSNPADFAYVRLDRSGQLTSASIARAGGDPLAYPTVDGRGVHRLKLEERFPSLIDAVEARVPNARLIVIESFGLMGPSGARAGYSETAAWLVDCQNEVEKRDLTILGTVHVPKQRAGSEITDPRQQACGSVAWAAFTATVMWLRRVNAMDPNDTRRQLYLLPRDKERMVELIMDSGGRLLELDECDRISDHLDVHLSHWAFEQSLPTSTVTHWAEQLEASEKTADRWIKRRLSEPSHVGGDMLERLNKGVYKRKRKA